HLGDATFELRFDDWREVGGMQVAHSQRYFLNELPIAEVTLTEVVLNPELDPTLFAIPDDLRAAAPGPASPQETPFQWFLRRQFSGWPHQSDALYGTLPIQDLAPGVGQVVGGSHNTLLVDAGDYLVAVDAPGDDAQSKMV